jgi:hypothetical protein
MNTPNQPSNENDELFGVLGLAVAQAREQQPATISGGKSAVGAGEAATQSLVAKQNDCDNLSYRSRSGFGRGAAVPAYKTRQYRCGFAAGESRALSGRLYDKDAHSIVRRNHWC